MAASRHVRKASSARCVSIYEIDCICIELHQASDSKVHTRISSILSDTYYNELAASDHDQTLVRSSRGGDEFETFYFYSYGDISTTTTDTDTIDDVRNQQNITLVMLAIGYLTFIAGKLFANEWAQIAISLGIFQVQLNSLSRGVHVFVIHLLFGFGRFLSAFELTCIV